MVVLDWWWLGIEAYPNKNKTTEINEKLEGKKTD